MNDTPILSSEELSTLKTMGMRDDLIQLASMEIERLQRRVAELEASRRAYASEFRLDRYGELDVGSIHQNIRNLKGALRSIRALATNHKTAYNIAKNVLVDCCGEQPPTW